MFLLCWPLALLSSRGGGGGTALPISQAAAQTPDLAAQVAERDTLVAAQENLLNAYRCMFQVDLEAVVGGCPPPQVEPGALPPSPTNADVEARDQLIAAQESLLNAYRCSRQIDLQAVVGGCGTTKPAGGDRIAYTPGGWSIFIMDADGGNIQEITIDIDQSITTTEHPYRDDLGNLHLFPSQLTWSPDRTRIAFTLDTCSAAMGCVARDKLFVADADGGSVRELANTDFDHLNNYMEYNYQIDLLDWSPDGTRIAFAYSRSSDSSADGRIFVTDADSGNALQVTDDGHFQTWSLDSTRIFYVSYQDDGLGLFVVDADGSNVQKLANYDHIDFDFRPWDDMDWSPDRTRFAYQSSRNDGRKIFVVDAASGNVRQLTDNDSDDVSPLWSPDGARIAFWRSLGGSWRIFVMDADGGNVRQITNDLRDLRSWAWSPDGTRIAFTQGHCYFQGCEYLDIFVVDVDSGDVQQLTDNDYATSVVWLSDGA